MSPSAACTGMPEGMPYQVHASRPACFPGATTSGSNSTGKPAAESLHHHRSKRTISTKWTFDISHTRFAPTGLRAKSFLLRGCAESYRQCITTGTNFIRRYFWGRFQTSYHDSDNAFKNVMYPRQHANGVSIAVLHY